MAEEIRGSRKKTRWIVGSLIVLVTVPIAFIIIIAMSIKQGVEFSPDDFSVRHFSYTRVEWLNWNVSKIAYEDMSTSFHQDLVLDGWVKPVTAKPKTWHLVSDSVSDENSPDFDASILADYLKMPFWEDWNEDAKNKAKAKALWPAVAVLARNYAYWAIPDLMDLVINQKSLTDSQFKTDIKTKVVLALSQNGDLKMSNKDYEGAEKSYTSALEYEVTSALLIARAKAYDELDEPDLATADRQAAKDPNVGSRDQTTTD